MRRLRLSTLLISINVGLLLLAVTGVAVVAVRLLRQLADDQALARVEQAGVSARNAVSRSGQVIQTDAQLLAERPTLLRLLQANDTESLALFLAQFQQTSQLDACAVIWQGRIVAQSGAPLDWESIRAAHQQERSYFFEAQPEIDSLITAAAADVAFLPDATVLVAVLLDQTFSRQISDEIGLPVTILGLPVTPGADQLAALRAQALAGQSGITARLDQPERYLAIFPLRAPAGATIGLVETELSATDIARSLQQLVQTLLWLALGVAALATLVSFSLGRRLRRPLQKLTNAAARIGHGDLSTPFPTARRMPAEIGTLAATLEEMRRRLLQLTANLQRQQAESNAIINGIVEGVFTVDRERRIQYLNPQAAAMLGLPPEDAIGRFCGDVLNPQRASNGRSLGRPCEEQCPIIHARFRAGARATEHLLLRNGQRRTVVITSAAPAEDQFAGEGLRQVQVMRDETEVEASRRLRDAVLANISHEFRTPLSAQLASIELLLDQLPDLSTEQIGELVLSLQRGTLRLTQLIDNLLESVRLEAGQFSIRRQPVSLDEVVEQALELTRPLIEQREQRVAMDLPYPLPLVMGDASRLTQVFVNLLANANKFAPPGSAIQIGGQVESESLSLWVEDQGPGLPPSGQSLFVPFVRSPSEEPEQGGVGLGLWIAKSIVERHGGRIEAQSRVVGDHGTRMTVMLPRERRGA
ncbi:MAG: ATP-binding protein [Anaerolineales bacterium]